MIARTFLTLSSFMTLALAVSTSMLLMREDTPTDADLLASCPGGPGSPNIKGADRCTLVSKSQPMAQSHKRILTPHLHLD